MSIRFDIQGLRALAVIFVVIFHINSNWLSGGFIGVDMFFVISGFLISKGMIKQITDKTFNYIHFLKGRIKRIVPAYIVMLIVVGICSFYVLIPSDLSNFLYDLRNSLIFMSNFGFAKANDYFGVKSYEKSFLHTWSLSIEMQFYLILPIFIYLIPKHLYKWFLGLGIVCVLFYTQFHINVIENKIEMYFSLLARSAEFGVGIAINFLPQSTRIKNKCKNIITILSLSVLLISCFIITESSSFPGLLAMPACLAVAVLIWLKNSNINTILGNKSLAYIGTLSYSLYLWHWPVLALYRYKVMRNDLRLLEIIILFIIIFILTLASYYLIEEPFRKKKKNTIYFGIIGLAFVVVLLWGFIRFNTINILKLQEQYTTMNGFNINNHNKYMGYFLMGDKKVPDDNIVLIGDSHGLGMTGFFDELGKKGHFNFSYFTTDSVVPLDGVPKRKIGEHFIKSYYTALPVVDKLIKRSDIIIVVKYWVGNENNNYFSLVLENLAKKITSSQHVIIVSDFPSIETDPVREYGSIVKPKNFKRKIITFPTTPKDVKSVIYQHKNFHFLELKNEEYFKDAPYYNDTLMYYDQGHLNYYGSSNYAKFEGDKVIKLLQQIKNK